MPDRVLADDAPQLGEALELGSTNRRTRQISARESAVVEHHPVEVGASQADPLCSQRQRAAESRSTQCAVHLGSLMLAYARTRGRRRRAPSRESIMLHLLLKCQMSNVK